MSIVTLSEVLDYLEISRGFFEITAVTKTLSLSYDSDAFTDVDLTVGTYDGDELATEIKTRIDSTLSITSTVTYSSSTKKFTIAVTAGHTIAYDHDNSDAGLIIGFNKDHSAALSLTSDEESGDPTTPINLILSACEDYVSGYCKRTFEETTYSLERYSGRGLDTIYLRNFPLITVDRVVNNVVDVIRIKNTNTGNSASVSVTSTGVRLVYNGTANTTVLFATYTTIQTVVNAINAIGSGWVAEVSDSTRSAFKSSDLLKVNGLGAINSNWVYLQIPDEGLYSFDVDIDRGLIYRESGWGDNNRDIYVDYSAGYSSTDMPEGLKLAVKMLVQYFYRMVREDNLIGVEEYFTGKFRTVMEKDGVPYQVRKALGRYKRVII